jgi:hypothetical protein
VFGLVRQLTALAVAPLIEAGAAGPPHAFQAFRKCRKLPHRPAIPIGTGRIGAAAGLPFGTRQALADPLRTFATTRARPGAPRAFGAVPGAHWESLGNLTVR